MHPHMYNYEEEGWVLDVASHTTVQYWDNKYQGKAKKGHRSSVIPHRHVVLHIVRVFDRSPWPRAPVSRSTAIMTSCAIEPPILLRSHSLSYLALRHTLPGGFLQSWRNHPGVILITRCSVGRILNPFGR